MRVLFRLFMINVGVLVACLAAGFALMLIEVWGQTIPFDVSVSEARFAVVINALIVSGFALFFAYLPAASLGFISEVFGWRSILLFAVAGGLIGLLPALGILPAWVHTNFSGTPLTMEPLKAYPAVGIIGGCAYWLVTGCKAGFVQSSTSIAPVPDRERSH